MKTQSARFALAVISFSTLVSGVAAQPAREELTPNPLIRIIRYEDRRSWNNDLKLLLSVADPSVRKRAALAAGRIGDPAAIPTLADMVLLDRDKDVRQMAAFALGEIEAPGGAYALTEALKRQKMDIDDAKVRARAVEGLGKIVGVMIANAPPATTGAKPLEDERLDALKAAIVDTLRFEDGQGSRSDKLTILLALTAVLRSRPDGAGPLVAKFLSYSDPEIIAAALNTMARLRLKDGNERVRELLNHNDPIVRANAARVIGAAEHKEAFEAVLDRALKDRDIRVRASAIRTLGSLKDARAIQPLVQRGNLLISNFDASRSELLEIATTLGRLAPNPTTNDGATALIQNLHRLTKGEAVEVEVAFARMLPGIFQHSSSRSKTVTWRQVSRRAQGLAAIKDVIAGAATGSAGDNALREAQEELANWLRRPGTPALALPDVLQAYASYKKPDTDEFARRLLQAVDVIVRSTAAEVIGGLTPSETNARALVDALPRALKDKDLNDAALAILDALGKQKKNEANDAIKTALNSDDHLIRRKAVALLKANGVGDFSNRIGLVKTRNTDLDYRRAMIRIDKHPTATVITNRGSFTIEFLPADATLNVDNFIQLAKHGYFNGQTIPRVVPNFVVQAGDPRGDQNGGPGYQIRCEINEVPYERASVGMALSGKDTGGSQWFVTHSPQPHLDGGYTVFGRVIRGMDVIDNIARGDVIRRVVVRER